MDKTYTENEEKSKPDDLDIYNVMGCSDVSGQVFSASTQRERQQLGSPIADGIKVRLLKREGSHGSVRKGFKIPR